MGHAVRKLFEHTWSINVFCAAGSIDGLPVPVLVHGTAGTETAGYYGYNDGNKYNKTYNTSNDGTKRTVRETKE